jgi:hypothetical protein
MVAINHPFKMEFKKTAAERKPIVLTVIENCDG